MTTCCFKQKATTKYKIKTNNHHWTSQFARQNWQVKSHKHISCQHVAALSWISSLTSQRSNKRSLTLHSEKSIYYLRKLSSFSQIARFFKFFQTILELFLSLAEDSSQVELISPLFSCNLLQNHLVVIISIIGNSLVKIPLKTF